MGLQERLGTFPAGGREVKGQLPVLKVAGGRPQAVPSSSPGSVSGGAGEGEVKGRVETAERSEVSLESSPARELTVLGAVAQVFQLQLQLPNADVLLGQLLFQPPDLILLPEEHSEKLVLCPGRDIL